MSNVIDFLERLGQDADLRTATDKQIDEALRALDERGREIGSQ